MSRSGASGACAELHSDCTLKNAVNARSLFKISPHWPARPRQPETQNSSCMPSASAHIPQRQCRSMAETKTMVETEVQ